MTRRRRPAKAPLSRAAIIEATLTLISAQGTRAVTLRAVAAALETGPASLYAYFANRDDLLYAALDAVYERCPLPPAGLGGDWRVALAASLSGTIDALASYPGLGSVALGTVQLGPGAMRISEHLLMLMQLGGVPDETAVLALDLFALFVAASAVEHSAPMRAVGAGARRRQDLAQQVSQAYAEAAPERYPRLHALSGKLPDADEPARSRFAINTLINGITLA
ncbi:TetR/AcrR family transcriptional regulator [Nonomuraea sp. MG754425]|uniref:TetR/AcrR family transcriptional regulator n=1 Tax=Nonomuraea sp. MG754425 TaxID=2570319 RepID=UPI001F381A8F|nr:TetR/AcrR family transcriptional regulator [Nonomuraea sp. MG754425]